MIHITRVATAALIFATGVLSSPSESLADEHGSKPVVVPAIANIQDAVNAMAYFQREVDANIASNKLGSLHGFAFAARDSALKIKGYAATLPADKNKELDERLGRVKSIATQLDKYGDAGKAAESKQFAAKLKEESDAIQKLTGVIAKADWKPAASAAAGDGATSAPAIGHSAPAGAHGGGTHH